MEPRFGITAVEITGFRTARDVSFAPRPLCALVGESDAGKSNLLAAIRTVLDPAAPPVTEEDAARDGDARISIRLALADAGEAALDWEPGEDIPRREDVPFPVLFLPAGARAHDVAPARPRAEAGASVEIFRRELEQDGQTAATRAHALVAALESSCARGDRGLLLLLEEPELYLRPQAQRYLYRLLREFAEAGNQAIYSTHSPAFLNVTRLDEIVFVERLPKIGTRAKHPEPVTADEDFRVLTEFDAARSELFLARAALLVEGLTEKLVLPFVFSALGVDVDREAISIVECGGKPNIPLFARICRATGIPFLVVHDSDRREDGTVPAGERALNDRIRTMAGRDRIALLDPDFEAVAGLTGDRRKPERAWREFAELAEAEMPAELVEVAKRAVALARS